MDLQRLRVVDNHCHLFLPDRETKSFETYWTLSRLPIPEGHLKNLMSYRMVVRELGRLLLSNPEEEEERILSTRKRLYTEDPTGYVGRLFDDAAIDAMIIDTGVPNLRNYGYVITMEEFDAFIPAKVKKMNVVRLETILDPLLDNKDLSFTGLVSSFEANLTRSVKEHNAVALKTAIAYETGLDIEKISKRTAANAYETCRVKRDPGRRAEKRLRDHLFRLALELCIRLDVPMQIHTGVGDAPVCDLRKANPLLLFSTLGEEPLRSVRIVLLHGGYPYLAETGSLANMYPNVWVDLSEMIPFAGAGLETRLVQLLEMAPVTKVLYGSDCYYIPEIAWFSAIHFKRCLGRVLDRFVEYGMISAGDVLVIASSILSDNACRLYGLELKGSIGH
jgi:predicted TIM-barrel fold metal-dependent hydrolase